MKKLYLLDAYALIYRAYYALIRAPRINSKGQNTSAIYGFVNTLEEILRKENPDYIAVAFDPAGKTFRHEAYAEYKAQREATPEDIKASVPIIKDIIRAYNIPILEVAGFEADDVIGTVAKMGEKAGLEVRMVTPDKDYAQLVTGNVLQQRPGKGGSPWEILGPEDVCEKYGLPTTESVIDYLALMGDAADNIPGCPGIGPKTAAALMQQFGSIENLLEHTEELKGAQKKKIEDNVEEIRFSKFLTTIRTDVPVTFDLDELKTKEVDVDALKKIFEDLEFRTFIERRFGSAPKVQKKEPFMLDLFASNPSDDQEVQKNAHFLSLNEGVVRYHLVDNEDEMRRICKIFLTREKICFDTETTSLEGINAELVGMSFAFEPFEAWYVAVPAQRDAAQRIVEIFRPLFESEQILKIGQNLKYDLTVLANYGVEVRGEMFDTMLAHYVVQPELRHNMDYLAEIYLNYRTIHIEDILGQKGKGQKTMRDLRPEEVYRYACEDADITLRLVEPLQKAMREAGVEEVFRRIEMPLMPVLMRMERNGVRIDTDALHDIERQFQQRLQGIETEIYELAGHEFLISSPRQVGEVLFDELKLSEKAKKTKKGQYSTGEEVLQTLAPKHPIVGKILAHRALKKLLSTYVEALPRLINPATGHIHTSFNQAVTATGRLSSSNPNLQNIPVRGEDGREIRKAFIPEEGCTFFSADYSQIELRIMAHLSGDEALCEAFNSGHDIHAATAARIFHKDIADVSRDERRKAKTANFGIIYGISAFGLAERMGVARGEAKDLINSYFETYPSVRKFINDSIDAARDKGYIETAFGRRRYLPDINSRNAVVRGYAERNAVNAPIQGTAADVIKLAMIAIDKRLRTEGFRARMILQVHDELNFSCPLDELDRLRAMVIQEMEQAYKMRVPLVADCGNGDNWLEAH